MLLIRGIGCAFLALVMLLLGYLFAKDGIRVLGSWSSIGMGFAACAFVWTVAGPGMLVGGAWMLGSLGRKRIPLRLAGASAIAAGASQVAGLLTYVIPCSGPD